MEVKELEFTKRKVGAPKKKRTKEVEKVLEKYKEKILINGKLVQPASAKIYVSIAKQFGYQQGNAIFLAAERYFSVPRQSSQSEFSGYDFDSAGDYDQCFVIDITDDDFIRKFEESRKNNYVRGLRAYLRLIIHKFTKYPCCWYFNKLSVVDGDYFIGSAVCKECGAKAFISTERNHTVLRITVKDLKEIDDHTKKAHATGVLKERIDKLLEKNTPYVTRSLLAAEIADETDEDASVIPKTKALSQQKTRQKHRETNLLHEDPIIALSLMKQNGNNAIHSVSLSPFYTMYSTSTQDMLLKTQNRTTRTIISMDATGVSLRLSPHAEISDRTGKMKRCFLYVVTLKLRDGSHKPIHQMLSQDHSSIQISLMINQCRARNNNFIPMESVMDQSAAFLLANVLSFTRFKSMHEYLSHCFIIMRDNDSKNRTCYIRIDRSHAIKTIITNATLNKFSNKITATFYKRILGFVIQETDVQTCEHIIKSMFTVLSTGYLNPEITEAVEELERTSNEHKVDKLRLAVNSLSDDDIAEAVNKESNAKNDSAGWIESLAAVNTQLDDSTELYKPNPYYAPSLKNAIIEILSLLPLYGNIMNIAMGSDIKSPTSSGTENDFDVLKNDLFNGMHGIRAEKFVDRHLAFTTGRLIGKIAADVREELLSDQSDDDDFWGSNDSDQSDDEDFWGSNDAGVIKTKDVKKDKSKTKLNDERKAPTKRPNIQHLRDVSSSNFTDDLSSQTSIAKSKGTRDCNTNRSTLTKYPDLSDSESEISFGSITEGSVYNPSDVGSTSDEFDHNLDKHENFGGHNEDMPLKKRKMFHRCKSSILDPLKRSCQLIPLLKNGHSTTKGKKRIVTSNTCAFDSYFHYLATAYVDFPLLKEKIEFAADSDPLCQLIIALFEAKPNVLYNQRNEVLGTYFNGEPVNPKLLRIDCETTPHVIFQKMCEENDFLNSYETIYNCKNCDLLVMKIFSRYVTINSINFDIKNVQEHIIQPKISTKLIPCCDECSEIAFGEIRTGEFIVIEADYIPSNQRSLSKYSTASIEEISQEVRFHNIKFALCGVIMFRKLGEQGHFYLCVKRPNNEWQMYDDIAAKAQVIRSDGLKTQNEVAVLIYKRHSQEQTQLDRCDEALCGEKFTPEKPEKDVDVFSQEEMKDTDSKGVQFESVMNANVGQLTGTVSNENTENSMISDEFPESQQVVNENEDTQQTSSSDEYDILDYVDISSDSE